MKYLSLVLIVALSALQITNTGCNSKGTTADSTATDTVRIVTIGPTVTAGALELGLGGQLVGTDATSRPMLGPDTAAANLGYHRTLNAEALIALRPTLVLASPEAGPPNVVQAVQAAGIKWVVLPAADNPAAAAEGIRRMGRETGTAETAATLANTLIVELDSLKAQHATGPHPRVLVLYARGSADRLHLVGRGTAAAALVEISGGTPALEADGTKPVSAEAVLQANPDWLLVPDETLAQLGGLEGVKNHNILGKTPAGKSGRVISVPSGALFGFSTQSVSVARGIAQQLHPAH